MLLDAFKDVNVPKTVNSLVTSAAVLTTPAMGAFLLTPAFQAASPAVGIACAAVVGTSLLSGAFMGVRSAIGVGDSHKSMAETVNGMTFGVVGSERIESTIRNIFK